MKKILFFLYWISCIWGNHLFAQLPIIMDMVHHNPGEIFTESKFNDPETLAQYGYNAQVVNEFQSVHTAITYNKLNKEIFPAGSKERLWADSIAKRIKNKISTIHKAGLEAYYFTDIIVLPKRLVEIYRDKICDESGRIDFTRPMTQKIHRIMLKEIFERFPELDGLVIRVGETYLQNTPYHTGNGPIPRDEKKWEHNYLYKTDGGENIHRCLINLLREEVCVRLNKKIFYRTWDFGYFHTNPQYYLNVTNEIEPHPNLYMCIKHVQGDYHRTFKFNPTLGIGKHRQIVEIECQREYEGKGAYPNYIGDGLLNGFEELKSDNPPYCLNHLKESPLLAGIWTWSRGGGWRGPYIKNELWSDINVAILAKWAHNMSLQEKELVNWYATNNGLKGKDIERFHKILLLSADAIVRGRASLIVPINVWWTRDQFIGGEKELHKNIEDIIRLGLVNKILQEKRQSIRIWKKIVKLSQQIKTGDPQMKQYLRISSEYGLLLYSIYEQGWIVMLKGYEGEESGEYDIKTIKKSIQRYDKLWEKYKSFIGSHRNSATAYEPYSFDFSNPPKYHNLNEGMKPTIDKYRKIVQ